MRRLPGWMLCVPALALLLLVAGYPLVRTLLYSFTDARLTNLDHPSLVGFENYFYLLRDPDGWRAARNTAIFALLSVSLEAVAGLIVALVLNSRIRLRGAVRTAVLIPWAIPAVVSARVWAWMFNDIYGVVNQILLSSGIIRAPVAWLGDDRWALLTLVIVDVWKTTPFMALMLLAGLQSIPVSVREAARVDGASGWKEFSLITLPLLKPALLVAVLFRALDALRVFDLPFVLTSNSKATTVLSVFARQQMVDFQEVGYASAASFLIFCLTGLLAVAYIAVGRRQLGMGGKG